MFAVYHGHEDLTDSRLYKTVRCCSLEEVLSFSALKGREEDLSCQKSSFEHKRELPGRSSGNFRGEGSDMERIIQNESLKKWSMKKKNWLSFSDRTR